MVYMRLTLLLLYIIGNILCTDNCKNSCPNVSQILDRFEHMELELKNLKQEHEDLVTKNTHTIKRLTEVERHCLPETTLQSDLKPKGEKNNQPKTLATEHNLTNRVSNGHKRLLGDGSTSSSIVAFSVALAHVITKLGYHQIIEYDKVITNEGHAYDVRHGHFIVPHKGLYLISVTALSTSNEPNIYLEVMLNGNRVQVLYANGNSGSESQTKTFLLILEQGDIMWIRAKDGVEGRSLWGSTTEQYNLFSGILLFPL